MNETIARRIPSDPRVVTPPMFEVPASALLELLAHSIRSADTQEKREALAAQISSLAVAYKPITAL